MKLRRADTFCRKCKHSYKYHCIFTFVQQGDMGMNLIKPLEIVPCNGNNFVDGSQCGCVEFEPLDNLEYLEWREQQKNSASTAIDDTIW